MRGSVTEVRITSKIESAAAAAYVLCLRHSSRGSPIVVTAVIEHTRGERLRSASLKSRNTLG